MSKKMYVLVSCLFLMFSNSLWVIWNQSNLVDGVKPAGSDESSVPNYDRDTK